MIYTVTCNPSLDYIVTTENFKLGRTNRSSSELVLPGGKGINVSTVLKHLGIPNMALGFAAGFTGAEIKRRVDALGVQSDFIFLEEGMSRINVKLRSIDGTEINGRGPDISKAAVNELLGKLDGLKDGDILVLAGSIPACLPDDFYQTVLDRVADREIKTVVDASGELLLRVLDKHPFLIKPNHHELGELFSVELKTREEVIPYGIRLREMGAVNVLVSMAGQGAVLFAEDGGIYQTPAPKGELVNSVGAGDSMVAGFLAGWLQQGSYEHAFAMGVAAGSASAFTEQLASKQEIEQLYGQLTVEEARGSYAELQRKKRI